MNLQAVALHLDERDTAQALIQVLRSCFGKHGTKQRYVLASHDRSGFERPACHFVGDLSHVHTGEFFNDPMQRQIFQVGATPFSESRRSKSQRQGMSTREVVDVARSAFGNI